MIFGTVTTRHSEIDNYSAMIFELSSDTEIFTENFQTAKPQESLPEGSIQPQMQVSVNNYDYFAQNDARSNCSVRFNEIVVIYCEESTTDPT